MLPYVSVVHGVGRTISATAQARGVGLEFSCPPYLFAFVRRWQFDIARPKTSKPLTPGCESVLFETKGQVGIEEINPCQESSGSKSREHVDVLPVG